MKDITIWACMQGSITRLLELLRALRQARISESEIHKQADSVELWVRIHPVDPSQKALAEQVAEVKSLLGVPLELNQIKIVFGMLDPPPEVVGIRTRSLVQILSTLGAGVEIPAEHLARGGVVPVDAA